MRKLSLIALALLLFSMNSGAQRRRIAEPLPADDHVAIRKVLDGLLLAQSEFFDNRDPETVFKFYAAGYYEISDGRPLTSQQLRSFYSKTREQLMLGATQRRALSLRTPPRITVFGDTALVTYGVSDKIGSQGTVIRARELWCTDVLLKQSGSWLITHEHCSLKAGQ